LLFKICHVLGSFYKMSGGVIVVGGVEGGLNIGVKMDKEDEYNP